ncbi:major capsid protein [Mycetocola spongiae]|uniref:major capsid protein n=1 Tax=Mycetocola spongiae TaxID=2859226 RepID=UPI001CF42996|nr:phage capsid protein [Mycetocola spongiae]UCR89253.1 phage capsid protein [Mycetocola spongiae]
MPVSLLEAKNNTSDEINHGVIDEFRKSNAILDSLVFDDIVNPNGGGGTLTTGYRRLKTQATASTRALNTEYTPQNVETSMHYVTLAVMGGTFQVDRVIAKLGAAASGAVALNLAQKAKSTAALFSDLVINGDVATNASAFDGLDKALTGSSTEFRAGQITNWADFDTDNRAEHKALDAIDEFLSTLDGTPTVIVGNSASLARVRAAARRANMYTKSPVDGLVGADGRPIERETYGGLILVDAGAKSGSNDQIIPIQERTIDGNKVAGLTDLYAYRAGLDGFHGVSTTGGGLIDYRLPDFTNIGAVQEGGVELGPVAVALKATKAAAVFRNIKVR